MVKVRTLLAIAQVLHVSCDALLYQENVDAQFETIKRLLVDQPSEYLAGIETIIRTCIESFELKRKPSADL